MEKSDSFFFNLTTRIVTEIKISNTKLVNATGFFSSEYILYIFKIITPFKSWYIKKRYSDIKSLYDELVIYHPKLKFPAFPPKRFFSTKESTIEERKNGFEVLFFFILNNIEILNSSELIDFLHIKNNILVIYIKNCILVHENKYSYELIDLVNSSCSSSSSNHSDDSIKKINTRQKLEIIKQENKTKVKSDDTKINNNIMNIINDKDKLFEIKNKKTQNNINRINVPKEKKEKKLKRTKKEKKNYNNNMGNSNYFRCFEDYKLFSEHLTQRSQASFDIVKEFLRNLKVHSSRICEIINDFTQYMKYKNKWKKFSNIEIKALLLGIKKEELVDDYFQYIFINEKSSNKKSSKISEKKIISNNPQCINSINTNINNINSINIINENNINNINTTNIFEIDKNSSNIQNNIQLEGLICNIGKFEENYLGARSCLLLLHRFFEKQFNPEVENYIDIFRKIDIKYIKAMNLCEFCYIKNSINQKTCFDILNTYIGGYEEEKQFKILTELNADNSLIAQFYQFHLKDNINNNPYNIE